MTRTIQYAIKAAGRCALLFGAGILVAEAQQPTMINLGTQGRNIDFSNAPSTRPVKTGSALPGTCSTGDLFFNTSAPAGQNLSGCAAPNTWTLLGAAAGLNDPGASGLVVRTAVNTTTAVAAPTGTVVGTTDAQTLTNKSIDASEINTGTLPGARMPAFSGDISTSAGSTATTLATVNSSPGAFGDSGHAVQVTVDGKGRITAISQVAIAGGTTGPAYYQTLDSNATAMTQRPTLNLSSAFVISDNSGAARTDVDLATVNSNVGTFGSSTQVPVFTVNGYGQITGVSTVAITGGQSSGAIPAGPLASMSSTCTAGTLYFATDQTAGQQIYTCSSTNTWTQIVNLGPSGALAYTGGSLDIVTSIVPRLAAANSFSGLNTFSQAPVVPQITPASSSATCTAGQLWADANYVYSCTATNTIKRAALSSF